MKVGEETGVFTYSQNLALQKYLPQWGKKMLKKKKDKVRQQEGKVTERSGGSEKLQKAGKKIGQCQSDQAIHVC